MYLFVKLWNPKPAWYALSEPDREAFIAQAQTAMQAVSEKGLETIGWMELRDEDNHKNSGYKFASIYKVPDRFVAIRFHNAMEEFGWYRYFDQVNAVGKLEGPGSVLKRIMGLKKPPRR